MNAVLKMKEQDNFNIEQVVTEITRIVEEEIKAYASLINTLVEEKSEILSNDSEVILKSNCKVKKILGKTKEFGKEEKVTPQNYKGSDNIKFDNIIPYIEKLYAERLGEFKNILEILSAKVETTNQENQYLLKHSMNFIDECLSVLISENDIK